MAALAGGLGALVLGVIGIILWWEEFIELLMGGVPLVLILGGALAAYLGFEEIRDKRAAESFEEPDTAAGTGQENLREEVQSLKSEIQELKSEKGELEGEETEKEK